MAKTHYSLLTFFSSAEQLKIIFILGRIQIRGSFCGSRLNATFKLYTPGSDRGQRYKSQERIVSGIISNSDKCVKIQNKCVTLYQRTEQAPTDKLTLYAADLKLYGRKQTHVAKREKTKTNRRHSMTLNLRQRKSNRKDISN